MARQYYCNFSGSDKWLFALEKNAESLEPQCSCAFRASCRRQKASRELIDHENQIDSARAIVAMLGTVREPPYPNPKISTRKMIHGNIVILLCNYDAEQKVCGQMHLV